MLVVDASAIAELLVGTRLALPVRTALGDHGLHAPHLLSIEVTSAVRTLVRRGAIGLPDAERAVRELGQLGIEWYQHEPFLTRCLELRELLSAYDALYVALAETLDAPLLTCDRKLAGAAGHRATVVVVHA